MRDLMHVGHALLWCRWMQLPVCQCRTARGCKGRHTTERMENIAEEAKSIEEMKWRLTALASCFLCPKII